MIGMMKHRLREADTGDEVFPDFSNMNISSISPGFPPVFTSGVTCRLRREGIGGCPPHGCASDARDGPAGRCPRPQAAHDDIGVQPHKAIGGFTPEGKWSGTSIPKNAKQWWLFLHIIDICKTIRLFVAMAFTSDVVCDNRKVLLQILPASCVFIRNARAARVMPNGMAAGVPIHRP